MSTPTEPPTVAIVGPYVDMAAPDWHMAAPALADE